MRSSVLTWRSAAMLGAAAWAFTRGLAYLPYFQPDQLPGGLEVLKTGTTIPITVYGIAWLVASACLLIGMFVRDRWIWALIPVIVIGALASGLYTASWLMTNSRDWMTAGSYWGPTIMLVALTRLGRRRKVVRHVETLEADLA